MNTNSQVPTESFFIANERAMALVQGGQLVTDRIFGVSKFFFPRKDSSTLTQSTRLRLIANEDVIECVDSEERTSIVRRGYVDGVLAVSIEWRAHDLKIEELYFMPLQPDVVVQRVRVTNLSAFPQSLRLYGILYPHLGANAESKKGVCREAYYDTKQGCVVMEDKNGMALTLGFDRMADEFQVGEVCGQTDVYFDLEDNRLSGHARLENVVPNAAVGLDARTLAPGAVFETELCLGAGNSVKEARTSFGQYKKERKKLWKQTEDYWHRVGASASGHLPPLGEFEAKLAAVEKQSVLVLKSSIISNGQPLGGTTVYQDGAQTRNSCYILLQLAKLGFVREAEFGLEHYTAFRTGDPKFASADENDQPGTILHAMKSYGEITRDETYFRKHRNAIFRLANRLLSLIEPKLGLIYSERAIHEFVAISRGYETYVNVMAFRGLRDAADMAQQLGQTSECERFSVAAEELRVNIRRHLIHSELGIFVKRIYMGKPVALPSVSMLVPPLFGVIDARDPVVTRTIEYVLEHIWDAKMGGIYRYPLHLQPWAEIPYGGPWVSYTCWLGRVYLLRGELDKARECLNWVIGNVPDDSCLIPEHFSVQHYGRRGVHRIYIEPSAPEMWATAEFLRFTMEYRKHALQSKLPTSRSSASLPVQVD
jgi:GH15 family glucan-1,4-alpha-glucosidase